MASKSKAKSTEDEAPKRRGLFGVMEDVADVIGNDIARFKVEMGNNRVRVITTPIVTWKHWQVPESSELSVVPCLQFFGDKMAEMADPAQKAKILAEMPECPWCKLEAEFGDKAMGKGKGFYNRQASASCNVVHDERVKIWEIGQKTVLRKLQEFENDEDWLEFMPNGLQDLEIIVTKAESKGGKTEYSVGGAPKPTALSDEDLAKYLKDAFDIVELVRPPDPNTEEGAETIAELLRKAGEPKKNDRPKNPQK